MREHLPGSGTRFACLRGCIGPVRTGPRTGKVSMEVYLDTRPLEEMAINGGNLEDMLVDIMSFHIPPDRVLSEVKVDGLTYSEKKSQDAAFLERRAINRLDLVTIPAAALAEVLLDSGPGHLRVLIEAASKMADEFRLNDEAEANEKFVVFLQAMQDFFSFLGQALDVLAIPMSRVNVEGLSAQERLQALTDVLTAMSQRQDEGDWILLADTIEYELMPVLNDWLVILTRVKGAAH